MVHKALYLFCMSKGQNICKISYILKTKLSFLGVKCHEFLTFYSQFYLFSFMLNFQKARSRWQSYWFKLFGRWQSCPLTCPIDRPHHKHVAWRKILRRTFIMIANKKEALCAYFLYFTKAPIALLIIHQCAMKLTAIEIWPKGIGKIHLGISHLPEQEIT